MKNLGNTHHIDHESYLTGASGAAVIVYRGVCNQAHPNYNEDFITTKTFETHIAFYKKYFNVISADDYYNHKLSSSRFNICLTFDNGLANNYTHALPLLEKYDVPAAFFITAIRFAGYNILCDDFLSILGTSGPAEFKFKNDVYIKNGLNKFISSTTGKDISEILRDKRFDDKAALMESLYSFFPFRETKSREEFWLQMTAEQIRLLSASPVATIGSYGLYHSDLGKIHLAYARNELVISKRFLEDTTGKKITSLAFPYGSYTSEAVKAAMEAGYTQLFAMDADNRKEASDALVKQRFMITPNIDIDDQMRSIIAGHK